MFKIVVIVNDDDGFTERHVKARTHVIERLANNKKCQKCRKRQRRFRVTQRDVIAPTNLSERLANNRKSFSLDILDDAKVNLMANALKETHNANRNIQRKTH